MRLLYNPVAPALCLAALLFFVLIALTWSWENVLEGVEGVLGFGFVFFLISSLMKTKHIIVESEPDRCSDIGTLLL